MSQVNKQQLEAVNQTNFPNNTTGYISPALLRDFNTDVIDSTVNQTAYTTDSASFDLRLDKQEAFSSSLAIDYINQTELNAATQSLSASLTTTINQKLNSSSFNTFTASTNGRLDTIEANYASKNAVNTFTQDQIIIGSLDIKESLIVDFSASFGSDVSMSGLDNYGDSRLGANASSINTVIGRTYLPGTLWINNVSWSFYSSSIFSANEFIGNNPNLSFNQFSISVDLRLDNLENFSSSLALTYATDAELAAVSGAIVSTFNTFSSSYKVESASFQSQITTNSASFASFSSSQYLTDSSSFNTRITTDSASLNTFSSSYKTESSSFDNRLDTIEVRYATTGSNTFVGDQIITGSLTVSSSAADDVTVYSRMLVRNQVGTEQLALGSFEFNLNSTKSTNAANGFIIGPTGSTAQLTVGVYDDPNFTTDVENRFLVNASGIVFSDWDNGSTFDYIPYMTIAPNVGNNPRPNFVRGLVVSGSSTFTGSVVSSGSVSGIVSGITIGSSTASIDMSKGNFFTLNIPTGSNTFITATNIQPGQTVAVKLSQAASATGSVRFNPSQFKFWSGSAAFNTGSAITGSTDIFTFVTFDTSSLWTTIVKNLV